MNDQELTPERLAVRTAVRGVRNPEGTARQDAKRLARIAGLLKEIDPKGMFSKVEVDRIGKDAVVKQLDAIDNLVKRIRKAVPGY